MIALALQLWPSLLCCQWMKSQCFYASFTFLEKPVIDSTCMLLAPQLKALFWVGHSQGRVLQWKSNLSWVLQINSVTRGQEWEEEELSFTVLNLPLDLEARDRGLSSKTLCMESEQILPDGSQMRHYDVHSLYGWSQTRPTYEWVTLLSPVGLLLWWVL